MVVYSSSDVYGSSISKYSLEHHFRERSPVEYTLVLSVRKHHSFEMIVFLASLKYVQNFSLTSRNTKKFPLASSNTTHYTSILLI
jgi:hypothetical protein